MNKNIFNPDSVTGRKTFQSQERAAHILDALSKGKKFIFGGGRRTGKTYLRNLIVQKEAAKRHQSINVFLQMNFAEIEIKTITASIKSGKLTVKIEHHPGFYSADCPKCGRTKILSSELNTLTAVCNGCYCPFLLEK